MLTEHSHIARSTRFYRKLHKWIAIPLLCFFLLIGITGLLLGWKKSTELLPPTQKGSSLHSQEWLSIARISQIAQNYSQQELKQSPEIDRIDIRPGKAVAKIVFTHHFTELQIDCTTGQILAVNTRYSDIIEKIHDGSIIDVLIQTNNEEVKLTYTTILSIGLILLSISGFWLWYNPKRIKKRKMVKAA